MPKHNAANERVKQDYFEYLREAKRWFESHPVLYQTYWNSNADYRGELSKGQYPAAGTAYRCASAARSAQPGGAGLGPPRRHHHAAPAPGTLPLHVREEGSGAFVPDRGYAIDAD